MTATQYLTQIEQKFCDEAFTCQASFPATAGETFADDFGASASECYADDAAYDMPDVVETEITAGKIHFDASAAASCIAGLTFPACTTFWTNGADVPGGVRHRDGRHGRRWRRVRRRLRLLEPRVGLRSDGAHLRRGPGGRLKNMGRHVVFCASTIHVPPRTSSLPPAHSVVER